MGLLTKSWNIPGPDAMALRTVLGRCCGATLRSGSAGTGVTSRRTVPTARSVWWQTTCVSADNLRKLYLRQCAMLPWYLITTLFRCFVATIKQNPVTHEISQG